MSTTDDLDGLLPPELLNARVRFWQCPIEEHRRRRGVVTVEWTDDIAHCTVDGCERNSTQARPTRAEIMSLVRLYALARITQNASTPSKRQRENATIVELHERDRREVERLEREINEALIRARVK